MLRFLPNESLRLSDIVKPVRAMRAAASRMEARA